MVWPVPSNIKAGLPYGVPGTLWMAGYHTGQDFPCDVGTPVYSTYDGVVVGTGNVGGSAYGYHQVMIESVYNGLRLRHLYAHMSAYLVQVGQHVRAGQRIGTSGAEGHVTGPHLHYEERVAPFDYWHHVKPVLFNVKETPVLRGLDISAYNPAAPLLDFTPQWVGIKVTEVYKNSAGQVVYYVNPKLADQIAWARSLRAAITYYMFGHASAQVGVSAESQVDFFLSKIPAATMDPTDSFAYDWEANGGAWPTCDEKDRSIRRIQAKQPQHLCGLYCNLYFWKNIDTTSFYGDFFWPADPNNPAGQPNVVAPWKIQQTGYLTDKQGNTIDADVLNFPDRTSMIRFFLSKQNVVKPPPVAPYKANAVSAMDQCVYGSRLAPENSDAWVKFRNAHTILNTIN